MTKAILVYEMVPESLRIYNLEVDDETLDKLRKCHNAFGNSTAEMTEEVEDLVNNWLPLYLIDKEPVASSEIGLPIVKLEGVLIYSGFNL